MTRKRMWAMAKATGRTPVLLPKPEPGKPAGKLSPEPTPPKFSQETRDIIARLVDLGRADLVVAVTERRISPSAAARIADRGEHRRTVPTKTKQAEPEPPRYDVKAMIA